MLGNSEKQETDEALRQLRLVLPGSWSVKISPIHDERQFGWRFDAILTIKSSKGRSAEFGIYHFPNFLSESVNEKTLSASARVARHEGFAGLIAISLYFSAHQRGLLEASDVSYLDTTGWCRITSDNPMLFINSTGAARSPVVEPYRTVKSLRGISTGWVIEALLTTRAPVGVRGLADEAGVSPSTVSKVLPLLQAEHAIERSDQGTVAAIDRRRVFDRWIVDYQVLKSNRRVGFYVGLRSLRTVEQQLAKESGVAFTGTIAASRNLPRGTLPVVGTSQIVAYVRDLDETISNIELIETEPGKANVILIVPKDRRIIENRLMIDGVPVVSLTRALADLATLPGRYRQAAESLLDSLTLSQPEWMPK